MAQAEMIKIFLGSPSDVVGERRHAEAVVEELNQSLCPALEVVLDLTTSTRTFPGFGKDGQAIINEQIGDMQTYDLFVAIFWNRIGTPTKRDISGTVEEFKRALKSLQTKKKPQIWLYFSNAPANLSTTEELEQRKGVVAFRDSIRKKGLRKEYQNPRDFATQFRMHLTAWLQDRVSKKKPAGGSKPAGTSKTKQNTTAFPPSAANPSPSTSRGITTGKSPGRSKPPRTTVTKPNAGIVKTPGSWIMLNDRFYRSSSTSVQADGSILLKITSSTLEEADELRSLQPSGFRSRNQLTYADRHETGITSVQSITSESRAGKTTFTVTTAPLVSLQRGGYEFSYSSYSADDIASLRARLILLGQPLPAQIQHLSNLYNTRSMPRAATSGLPDTLPRLWATLRTDMRSFLPKAWLFAAYMLKMGGIIEKIKVLEIGPRKNNSLKVRFQGQRPISYTNHEPMVISVEGECRLER